MSQATNTNIDEKEYLETMSRSKNAIEVYERTRKNSVGTKKTQISHKEAIGLLMEISNMSKEEAESFYRSIYMNGKDAGIRLTCKKIEVLIKKAIVGAGFVLCLGAAAVGVAKIKEAQHVKELFNNGYSQNIEEDIQDSAFRVNNNEDVAYHYDEIAASIVDEHNKGYNWLFGFWESIGVPNYMGDLAGTEDGIYLDGLKSVFNYLPSDVTGYEDFDDFMWSVGAIKVEKQDDGSMVPRYDLDKLKEYIILQKEAANALQNNEEANALGGR